MSGNPPVDQAALEEEYVEIVRQAGRAASAHNTQPWQISQEGSNLVLDIDLRHVLGPSDPSGRDTVLSLGSFVETMLICAQSAGRGLRFVYEGNGTRVGQFEPAQNLYSTPWGVQDVRDRRVWRGRWQDGVPAGHILEHSADLAEQAGFRLAQMSTRDSRKFVVRANRWFFSNSDIVAELHRWTRLSAEHPAYYHDGLNDVMLVLTKIERAILRTLIRPSFYRVLRMFGLPALLAHVSAGATRGSGLALGVIGPLGTESQLAAGRLLTRLWLYLRTEGLYVQPHSALVDCPSTRAAIDTLWQVKTDEQALIWFRVGVPVSDPNTRPAHPRRELGSLAANRPTV